MPRFGPLTRQELVRYMTQLGFEGPFSGGKHQFVVRGDAVVWIPNPHRGDIGRELLARLLRQAGISREQLELL